MPLHLHLNYERMNMNDIVKKKEILNSKMTETKNMHRTLMANLDIKTFSGSISIEDTINFIESANRNIYDFITSSADNTSAESKLSYDEFCERIKIAKEFTSSSIEEWGEYDK